jgi:uncharacterized membrane protein YukC
MPSLKIATGLGALLFSTIASAAVPGQLEDTLFKIMAVALGALLVIGILYAVVQVYIASRHRNEIKRAEQQYNRSNK